MCLPGMVWQRVPLLYNTRVLSSGAEFLPAAMQQLCHEYETTFTSKFPSRSLLWSLGAGAASVLAHGPHGARVRLEVSTLQAIVLSTLNSATGKSGSSCVSLEPLVRAVASAARLSPHTTRRLLCAAVAPLAAGAQPLLSVSDESAEALSVGISAAFSWRQHDGHRLSFSEGGTGDVFRAQPATVATAYPSLPSWRGDMVDAAILRVLKQAPGRRVALATLYPAVVVRGGVRVCRL